MPRNKAAGFCSLVHLLSKKTINEIYSHCLTTNTAADPFCVTILIYVNAFCHSATFAAKTEKHLNM